MHWETVVVSLSLLGAALFAFRAKSVANHRTRVLLPALGLTILAVYEIWMTHWEKTVSAAIRLDMFLEIPLMFAFILWGVLGTIFSGQVRTKSPEI
jgi:cytochrome bd-type quinol oxidase subunit 2